MENNNEFMQSFIKKYRYFLSHLMSVYLNEGMASLTVNLNLTIDKGSWTDKKQIHIGMADCPYKEEEKAMIWTLHRLGHECQHILSTTEKAWKFALQTGYMKVIEALSYKYEKRIRRFRREQDYDLFLEELAVKYNVKISRKSLLRFIHFICNSIEDGRIERIRSISKKQFKNYAAICRAYDWDANPVTDDFINMINEPVVYLSIILNQILSLSTCSLYQKDFIRIFENDSHVLDVMNTLIPHIRKGIEADCCRDAMSESVMICELLADVIAEASRITPFEELLNSLEGVLCKAGNEKSEYFCKERDEKKGSDEKGAYSLFGISDLNRGSDKSEKGDAVKNEGKGEKTKEGKTNAGERNFPEDMQEIIKQSVNDALKESSGEVSICISAGKVNKSILPGTEVEKNSFPETKTIRDLDISSAYTYDVTFNEYNRDYPTDMLLPAELQAKANSFKRQVKSIFENMSSPKLRGMTSGKLDNGYLYKLVQNDIKVFMRKEQDAGFNGCAEILIDNSGSMDDGPGSKRYHCNRAVAIIEHALTDIMPLRIIAFDADSDVYVNHLVIKDWNETIPRNGVYNFLTHRYSGSGNKDGYSIRRAASDIINRPEREKLLFILSDGLPTEYKNDYSEGIIDVKDSVKQAEKMGINVFSIYFGPRDKEIEEAFHEMYGNRAVITDPENVCDELKKLLKICLIG